ncbi:flavin reductase family protein [Mesorhizobium sp. B2-3-15]|nr:flavin reductase family protein [Mesorhizobium sp. B2-3-15]
MIFDCSTLPEPSAYRLLSSVIIPRPIAWVVTIGGAGQTNVAPFSFFNLFSCDPPTVCIGINAGSENEKDTIRNIRKTRELVINMVPEALSRAMNVTAIGFPYGVDEMQEARLTPEKSQSVRPPRIAESPVSIECNVRRIIRVGSKDAIVVAMPSVVRVKEEYVIDKENAIINIGELCIVGRVQGSGKYIRLTDSFDMPRLTIADWPRKDA